MKKQKYPGIHFRATEEMITLLEQEALRQRITVSDVVRIILWDALDPIKKTKKR